MKNQLVIMSLVTLSSVAFAARQGNTGTSSSGEVDISLKKQHEVRISNLQDIDFGSVTQTPGDQQIDVCIYSTTGEYDITPSAQHGSGATFRLGNGANTAFINYDLEWKDSANGNGGTNLENAQTSPSFRGADRNRSDCGGGVNARLFVSIDQNSFQTAPADTYADTLTLVVAPR